VSYSLIAKRLRLPLGFATAAAYLAFAQPSEQSLWIGAGIAFCGLLIRAWASGHIMKNDRLATAGPYAHTRNPLYFGSFLIGCGFAAAAHWSVVLAVAAFFALIYVPTMQRERANIAGRFPAEYAEYSAHVPAFFPRLAPWRPGLGDADGFSRSLYMKHGEWKAALGFVGAFVWLSLRLRGVV
jgi:protein-S-isoprenylcysteine O-methyltransferase Ste14